MDTPKPDEPSSGDGQRHEKSLGPFSVSAEIEAPEKSETREDASRMSQNEHQREKPKAIAASSDDDDNEVPDDLLIEKGFERNEPKCSRCQYQKVACYNGFPCRACKEKGYSAIECRTGVNKGDPSDEEYERKRLGKMEEDDPFGERGTKAGFSNKHGFWFKRGRNCVDN